MHKLNPYLSKEKIEKIIQDMGKRISDDYKEKHPIFICVLKGSFVFLADLIRAITIPATVDFIQVTSYGCGTLSSGKVKLIKEITCDIKNKDIIIVEDIIDSGLTLEFLTDYITSLKPASIKICALLEREEYRKKAERDIDYSGCLVSKEFLVGYGLDFAEQYRHMPEIYSLQTSGENE